VRPRYYQLSHQRRGFAWSREHREGFLPSRSRHGIGGWIVLAGLEWIVGLEGVGSYVRIGKGRVSSSRSLLDTRPSLSLSLSLYSFLTLARSPRFALTP